MGAQALIWLVFTACLGLSFLLSGMEAGVFALSRLRIRQQMRSGGASAAVLHRYLEEPEDFLWTILVGNTVANFIILGWLVAVLHQPLQHHQVWFVAVFSITVFLFYAFFDLLPKMLFRMYPNRLCVLLARPFRLIHLALRPLVALVESFSGLLLLWRGGKVYTGHLFGNREELRHLMQESGQAFSSEERAMINRVLDLQSLTVRQAMRPLAQVVSVSSSAPISQVLALCRGPVPRAQADPVAGLGNTRRPATDCGLAKPEYAALPGCHRHPQSGRRLCQTRPLPGRGHEIGSSVAALTTERAASGNRLGPRPA